MPEGLQEIIDKALAKQAEGRYQNAGQLRRDLLALKMQLFPYSNEDYTQELGQIKSSAKLTTNMPDADGATVIMQPVRSQQPLDEDLEKTMTLPPVQAKAEVQPEPAAKLEDEWKIQAQESDGEEQGGAKGMVKKKLNYTKLIIYITACVVAISVVAHFIFSRNLKE